MMPSHRLLSVSPRTVLVFALACGAAFAQAVSTAPPPEQEKTAPEMTTRDEPATFRSRVNLVMIPVVVRDKKGSIVGTLKREDFILSERGKPQQISRFSVEKSGAQTIKFAEESEASPAGAAARVQASAPQRFVAYLFDDVHAAFSDLARSREAAIRHLNADLGATGRAAIYTTSGRVDIDFTDDKDKLRDALMRLQPSPIAHSAVKECPDINPYMADMMVNSNDCIAIGVATREAVICDNLQGPTAEQTGMLIAMGVARNVLNLATHETRVSLDILRQVVLRMGAAPGQRVIVLASPGFLSLGANAEKMDVVDRAIKAGVIINGLDIRGLYTDATFDASTRRTANGPNDNLTKDGYVRAAQRAESDVLAEITAGTGGKFFENNNNFLEGFHVAAAAPETFYLLGFSPQNLKLDGAFHDVKVTLKTPGLHYDLQSRKGYYAPKHINDEKENAKTEIEDALFSRDELKELPVALHTQFFKGNDGKAVITVIAHLDLKKFQYKKDGGRNDNQVTMVSGLFDRNGTMVEGIQKILDLSLKDDTLQTKLDNGITVRSQFSAKPGTYLVRLVVRDKEGQMISAQNSAVDIP